MTKEEIKDKLREGIVNCPHRDAIISVAIFGSYVNGNASEDSDVDVLIDFAPDATIGFFALAHIKRFLEGVLGITVDLLTPAAISKYFRDAVLQQAEYLYER